MVVEFVDIFWWLAADTAIQTIGVPDSKGATLYTKSAEEIAKLGERDSFFARRTTFGKVAIFGGVALVTAGVLASVGVWPFHRRDHKDRLSIRQDAVERGL